MNQRTTNNNLPRHVGDMRPSQLIGTFGVGSLIDLPHFSAMVMGLDEWQVERGGSQVITEERLLAAVQRVLGNHVQRLITAPVVFDPQPFEADSFLGAPVGVFPRWMQCPHCSLLARVDDGLFTLKHDQYHPDRTRYVHEQCPGRDGKHPAKAPAVVPARFLVACENGHVDDFPWREFAHGGLTDCRGTLRLNEYDSTGDARALQVSCSCGKQQALSRAFGHGRNKTMPFCRGRHPHLDDFDPSGCDQQVKAVLLGASNLWFADTLTALALPSVTDSKLDRAVSDAWGKIGLAESIREVDLLRNALGLPSLTGYSNDEVYASIERIRESRISGIPDESPTDLKTPEWELFSNPNRLEPGEVLQLREVRIPEGFVDYIQRVVLVDKLREVRALVGFTRVEPPNDALLESLTDKNRRAPLARNQPTWVPATEIRGEGIFVQVREDALESWSKRPEVKRRDVEFRNSHESWCRNRGIIPTRLYPGIRYVLLHSLAHALMRRFVLECGYTASSLKERIYSRLPNVDPAHPEPMAGILIYTAAADSEGTLGGLISLGAPEQLRTHLAAALHDLEFCASDPVCAEHSPDDKGQSLHASSCHACLFAPETACEIGNKHLDRSVLVPTVETADLAYFESYTQSQ